ncbi:phosphatidylinositol-glycan biosynthesis class X protein [Dipodomys merriami]|uniref:phosphatidylinositol-glycan biosynthesis class X protein n=1 Tax=Dipodomys merriami TaxID=94247 RepID=UPI003855B3BE
MYSLIQEEADSEYLVIFKVNTVLLRVSDCRGLGVSHRSGTRISGAWQGRCTRWGRRTGGNRPLAALRTGGDSKLRRSGKPPDPDPACTRSQPWSPRRGGAFSEACAGCLCALIWSSRAPLGRPRSGVLAAQFVAIRAVAWLLVGLAGLTHSLASAFSDAPFGAGIRATCSEIILRQEVLKDGFHRDLVIKVKFGESIEDLQTCRLLIKHYIPTGLFVDPYELASLREKNITEAVMVSEHFNIEAPNYLSRESEILMYARKDVQCIDCFHAFLPVHYRYHRPQSKDGETHIVVNNPDLLMYCDQEFPVLKCWAQSKVAAPCAFKSKDICQWNSMKYKSILKNVTLHVPVGLTIHTSLVCSVTLLITILCSILILLAVFKYGHFFI